MRPLLGILLLACIATAAPVPKGMKGKKDAAALLIGKWRPDGGSGSEGFTFDADGVMRALKTGRESPGVPYTYAFDTDPDAAGWRMTWTGQGQAMPSYQAVFEVDGDKLKLHYNGAGAPPVPKPSPDNAVRYKLFTRDPSGK